MNIKKFKEKVLHTFIYLVILASIVGSFLFFATKANGQDLYNVSSKAPGIYLAHTVGSNMSVNLNEETTYNITLSGATFHAYTDNKSFDVSIEVAKDEIVTIKVTKNKTIGLNVVISNKKGVAILTMIQ